MIRPFSMATTRLENRLTRDFSWVTTSTSGTQLVDALQQHHDLQGSLGVQVPRGLVGDDHAGVVDQSPGDGHPLLLAAGELPRILVRLLLQPHQLQHIGDAPAHLPGGGADGPHGKGQVLIHRLLLNQPEVLENDAQRPAHIGHLSWA